MCELLNEAEQCVYVGVGECNKTMSRRSCTAALIYWWNISPMCRSRTQQFRTIKTYSPGPVPHRNMHKTHTLSHTRSLMHGYLHECTHTIYKHIPQLLLQAINVSALFCATFLYIHIHINMQQLCVVCDQAKCFVSLLQPPFIALMVLL